MTEVAMKNMSGSSPSPAQDSLALDSAQHMLEAWTRAWRDSTQGILTAGLEHLELTQSLNDKAFEMLEHLSRPATPRDMADEWLRLVRPTFETAVNGYRRINDELATCLFSGRARHYASVY
jgi:hypothetical protein